MPHKKQVTKKGLEPYSAGARYERKAFRNYLRRAITKAGEGTTLGVVLQWVMDRQARYDKKPGGL